MGHTYERNGARRDPGHVPPPPRFFPLPSQSLVLSKELEELSQLGGKAKETIAYNMQTSLANVWDVLDENNRIPPPLPRDLSVPFYVDAFLVS